MTDPAAKLRELLIGDRLDITEYETRRVLESLRAEFPKQLSNRRDRREEDKNGLLHEIRA